jgi:nitroimidazol reductase NimA-like FMN-containing flavoprotein (pyridoxamine 5'-phosphate oxidase superfamily)
MSNESKLRNKIQSLLSSQELAVLSTGNDGIPYANLVAFAAEPDLKTLYFATARSTRKFRNLSGQPAAAMLVDNRSNREEDFHEAAAVTVVGKAGEIPHDRHEPVIRLYLARHPYLKTFVEAPTCAMIALTVERYIYVERFQDVTELRI